MSRKINVAILGLGKVGEVFAEHFLSKIQEAQANVQIVAVAARNTQSPVALGFAHNGVTVLDNALDVVKLGDSVDIVFDLTGDAALRKSLREHMQAANNRHTVIAPEVMAHLLWAFFDAGSLPESGHSGYD